jgi:hypothetical protein
MEDGELLKKTSFAIDSRAWRAAKIAAAEQALTLKDFLRNAIIREFCHHRGDIAVLNAERKGILTERQAPTRISDADRLDLLRLRLREKAEERSLVELERMEEFLHTKDGYFGPFAQNAERRGIKIQDQDKTKKGGDRR